MSNTVLAVLAVAILVAIAVVVVSLVMKLLRLAVIVAAITAAVVVGWLVVRHHVEPDVQRTMDDVAAGAAEVGRQAVKAATGAAATVEAPDPGKAEASSDGAAAPSGPSLEVAR